MKKINSYIKIIILLLLTISCQPGAASNFRCDTPEDSLFGTFHFFPEQLWPDGIVPYVLNISLTTLDVNEVFKAIYDFQNKTCIRFVPKPENESIYVSIEHDDDVCGMATICRNEGYNFAKFGQTCNHTDTMIHEFGHNLCLLHEMNRKDRDDYLIPFCGEGTMQEKNDFDLKGYMYDYNSIMHYECYLCEGGRPKKEDVYHCGFEVTQVLSVLDADKINDVYGCQGCLSHRWRSTQNLTDADKAALFSFGKTVNYKDLYLCRAYIGPGTITPGQYDLKNNECNVILNNAEHKVKDFVQVFTVPNENTRNRYKISMSKNNLVPVGRTRSAITIYAAWAEYKDMFRKYVQVIGKVYENDLSKAYFWIENRIVVKENFSFVTCS